MKLESSTAYSMIDPALMYMTNADQAAQLRLEEEEEAETEEMEEFEVDEAESEDAEDESDDDETEDEEETEGDA